MSGSGGGKPGNMPIMSARTKAFCDRQVEMELGKIGKFNRKEGQLMTTVIITLIVLTVLGWIISPSSRSREHSSGGPMVMRSDNGYEGHLDFLEMHGFITEEEREADRAAIRHYRDHPEQYVTMTFEEAFGNERIER
jgi:hypothetical protein